MVLHGFMASLTSILFQDPDNHLPAMLKEGVDTGLFDEIKPSGLWPAAKLPLSQLGLETCKGNWKHEEEDPDAASLLAGPKKLQ